MRILLTGHEGYLGQGLLAYLQKNGHEVTGWGRREELLKLNRQTLEAKKISAVVNMATVMDREGTHYDASSETERVNVGGARHLADILKGSSIFWIQISTKDIFGPAYTVLDVEESPKAYRPRFLVGPNQPFNPVTVYAKSKLIAEFITESHPLSTVIRLSTCYTDFRHHRGNWMTRMIRALLRGEPVTISHNGKQFRDPLHVDDLGRLIERVVEKRMAGLRLNAGGGTDNLISLLEFIDFLNLSASIRWTPGDDYGFAFDDTATKLTGWTPTIRIRDRIGVMVDSLRTCQKSSPTT